MFGYRRTLNLKEFILKLNLIAMNHSPVNKIDPRIFFLNPAVSLFLIIALINSVAVSWGRVVNIDCHVQSRNYHTKWGKAHGVKAGVVPIVNEDLGGSRVRP